MFNYIKRLSDFKHTRISLSRPLLSYEKVRLLYSSVIRNKRFQLKRIQSPESPYLDIGCGQSTASGFVNIDYGWWPNVDLCWDIRGGLPFDDGSVQGIFTEHCLEHLTLEECRKVLREFRRILKKGGIARIVVPDGELYANLYLDSKSGKEVHFPNADRMVESRPGGADLKTPMFYLNDIFCNYGHKFTFDAQTLVVLLQEAGFKDMQKEGFMRGRDKKLLIDRIRRKEESLYIEAVA